MAATARHLSIADLADREGVPMSTVYRWNSTGTGPKYLRVGKHVRYRVSDVERWEDARVSGGDRRPAA